MRKLTSSNLCCLFFKTSLFMLLCFGFATDALAFPPKRFIINSLTLQNEKQLLAISMELSVDNEDGLRDLLKDGAVIELKIKVDMERRRSWWSNAKIAEIEYISVIRHDPLSREFLLTMPNDSNIYKDRNLTRLLSNTWQKLYLPMVPKQRLDEEGLDNIFIINGEATLNHMEVPPWLASSSFWSAEIIPSAYFSLEYSYR